MAVMMRSMLEVADNSGARKLQVILPLGGGVGLTAHLGDVFTACVKEASPDGNTKKGTVVKCVLVRAAKRRAARTARTSASTKTPLCSSTTTASRSGHASSGL